MLHEILVHEISVSLVKINISYPLQLAQEKEKSSVEQGFTGCFKISFFREKEKLLMLGGYRGSDYTCPTKKLLAFSLQILKGSEGVQGSRERALLDTREQRAGSMKIVIMEQGAQFFVSKIRF